MPHINELSRRRDDFWYGLKRTVLLVLAGAVVLVGLIIWGFV